MENVGKEMFLSMPHNVRTQGHPMKLSVTTSWIRQVNGG